jgi:enolase
MNEVIDLDAREILDSRGNPTIEVDCRLEGGHTGRAAVPSGASTGEHEALELRDGDSARFSGKGVRKAIANVREVIRPELLGSDVANQQALDARLVKLDGTPDKSRLGANAVLGVSMAACRAAAASLNRPLHAHLGGTAASLIPVPMLNVINGGAHAPNRLDLQEYMIVPAGAPSFGEAMRYASEVYQALRKLLLERGMKATVGDEGGFAPDFASNEEPLKVIVEAISRAGYVPGKDIFVALDPAPSGLYRDGKYLLETEDRALSAHEMTDMYSTWVERYPIISIEDGLAEDDWAGWVHHTAVLGKRVQLIGDDIFVTNIKRLKQGIDLGIANAVLIKPNQIGTVSETIECIELARRHNYRTVISHRSGETEDTFIADLAVATNAGQIKSGAPCRGERTAKYNQLIRLEQATGAAYSGLSCYNR